MKVLYQMLLSIALVLTARYAMPLWFRSSGVLNGNQMDAAFVTSAGAAPVEVA